jgi:hypothetical protein
LSGALQGIGCQGRVLNQEGIADMKKMCCKYKKEWDNMNKVDELRDLLSANVSKVTELLNKKEKDEEKKKCPVGLIFAIIGIVAVVAAAAYGLYRFFAPDYLEDFEDDFDDDFEDDFFDEDDDEDEEEN